VVNALAAIVRPVVTRRAPRTTPGLQLPTGTRSMNTRTLVRLAALLSVLSSTAPAEPSGTAFTCQGRVQVGAADFIGTGQFKFALVTRFHPSPAFDLRRAETVHPPQWSAWRRLTPAGVVGQSVRLSAAGAVLSCWRLKRYERLGRPGRSLYLHSSLLDADAGGCLIEQSQDGNRPSPLCWAAYYAETGRPLA